MNYGDQKIEWVVITVYKCVTVTETEYQSRKKKKR